MKHILKIFKSHYKDNLSVSLNTIKSDFITTIILKLKIKNTIKKSVNLIVIYTRQCNFIRFKYFLYFRRDNNLFKYT